MTTQKALKTKERILTAAKHCFLLYGYHATGLEQIIKAAKITKGNFYYHFKSKEALALATLEKEHSEISKEINERVLNNNKSSLENLFALLDLMVNKQKYQYQEEQTCGCYFGNFALELSNESTEINNKIKHIFKELAQLISTLIENAIIEKELSQEIDSSAMGNIILSQMEGAILLDKTNQKPQQMEQSIVFIKQYLSLFK
jgi:TetR/AcrR family transcriptional repressor of nem operon